MPTITRWFRVTHDINSDPEIWELRELYGDRAALVWLEMLSIADRNSGNVGMNNKQFYSILASKCRVYAPKTKAIIEWCLTRKWLVELDTNSPRIAHELLANIARTSNELPIFAPSSQHIHGYLWVVKWRKYNRVREVDELLSPPTPSPTPTPKPLKEHTAPSAAPKKEEKPSDRFEPLVKLAVQIGGRDETARKQLVQWTLSMVRQQHGDPEDRVFAVTKICLESVQRKIESGYQISSIWGLLQKIFTVERTKYIQGPENEAHKSGPIPDNIRTLIRGIGN